MDVFAGGKKFPLAGWRSSSKNGACNMTKRRDPMDREIESAPQAGHFIGWNQGTAFVSGLENLEREIAALAANSPARAAALYEAFIAACNLKAEEIDDSDGEFGMFAGNLFRGWIQARQAAGANPGATAETLLAWMNNDEYGFSNERGSLWVNAP